MVSQVDWKEYDRLKLLGHSDFEIALMFQISLVTLLSLKKVEHTFLKNREKED